MSGHIIEATGHTIMATNITRFRRPVVQEPISRVGSQPLSFHFGGSKREARAACDVSDAAGIRERSRYVLSLTRAMHYSSPRLITGLLKSGEYLSGAPGTPLLERLAALTRHSIDDLRKTTVHVFASKLNMTVGGPHRELDELALQRYTSMRSSNGLRLCPLCIREGNPLNVLWHTRLTTLCLQHRTRRDAHSHGIGTRIAKILRLT